ncbi:alpha/beta hydrolase [Paracoccaceae bacterium Fryx2]|nr:alpha/beta hydrolase [Paracoccaceae bacterium Fryx2]
MSDTAPLYAGIAEGPADGRAFWLTAADGVRLRAAHWPAPQAKGTVLLFPGRSEYAEKYGIAAGDLAARGYHTLVIDWRGQGLSDRALADPMTGHVGDFSEFQLDVEALADLADTLYLPGPRHLMSHSMGGCIALRSVMMGLPVRSAVFSAPMWGIRITPALRPVATTLGWAAQWAGQSHRYAPGTSAATYVADAPFEDNVLTTDPEMYALMQRQVAEHPELGLGGPSLGWLRAALIECRALAALPAPDLPALTMIGSRERVVDPAPVQARMANWPKGRLEVVPGAEHEVIMETAAIRARFFDAACALFDG